MARPKKTENISEEVTQKKSQKRDYVFAVGRRREAAASVRLYDKTSVTLNSVDLKKGDIFVNHKPIEQYFTDSIYKNMYSEPLRTTNTLGKYIFTIRVAGGGKAGQIGAVVHGISRALASFNSEKFRDILKKKGFLTRDSRTRERRKVGMGGKARRKRQSPKR